MRRVSASPATKNPTKPTNCGTTYHRPRCASTMALRSNEPAIMTTPDERQPHEDLVAEHLRGGPQAPQQRVLAARRPAGQGHAVHAERRHGQEEQQADVEVLHHEAGASGMTAKLASTDADDDRRRSTKTGLSANGGIQSSLNEQLDGVGQHLQLPQGAHPVGAVAGPGAPQEPALHPAPARRR